MRVGVRNNDPPRYEAARATALAGTGQGRDAPTARRPGAAQLRGQALAYLRQERAASARELDREDPAMAKGVRHAMTSWLDDSDLNAVRQPERWPRCPRPSGPSGGRSGTRWTRSCNAPRRPDAECGLDPKAA